MLSSTQPQTEGEEGEQNVGTTQPLRVLLTRILRPRPWLRFVIVVVVVVVVVITAGLSVVIVYLI